jgi:hypothetical protein
MDSVSASIGKMMLDLLPPLAEACEPYKVWGLTSLAHLWLLPTDDWKAPRLVCITAMPEQGYRIQYRLPSQEAPWLDATVEGRAQDEATACRMVLIAMERSKGWLASK